MCLGFPVTIHPEHGTIWILGAVRFPTLNDTEIHPLMRYGNPDYTFMTGDPNTTLTKPPTDLIPNDWLAASSSTPSGQIPYGQHYRYQGDIISRKFRDIDGFPFLSDNLSTLNQQAYHQPNDYDEVFASGNQLGHWQLQSRLHTFVDRLYPTTRQSIYASTY